MIPLKNRSFIMCVVLAMCSKTDQSRAGVVPRQGRRWSLVVRLVVFFTLGASALLLVTMAILYGIVVQHGIANDTGFLVDKLRAVQADLLEKKGDQTDLLADEVPSGASDYFIRVLDRQTGHLIAERPETGER